MSRVGYACDFRTSVPVLKCDVCGVTAAMVRNGDRVQSPPGWTDAGEEDYCPMHCSDCGCHHDEDDDCYRPDACDVGVL